MTTKIKDKVRYYDIQASVKSKTTRKRKEHYPDIQELWHMFRMPNLIISREAEATVMKIVHTHSLNRSSKFTKAREMPIYLELPEQITREILMS